MDNKASLTGEKSAAYLNRRTLSSRKGGDDGKITGGTLQPHPSARTIHGARSIHLKPDLIMNQSRPGSKLVPSYTKGRNQSIQPSKVASEQRLPGKLSF